MYRVAISDDAVRNAVTTPVKSLDHNAKRTVATFDNAIDRAEGRGTKALGGACKCTVSTKISDRPQGPEKRRSFVPLFLGPSVTPGSAAVSYIESAVSDLNLFRL